MFAGEQFFPAVKIEGDWTLAKSSKAWVITDVSPDMASRAIERFEIFNDFIGQRTGHRCRGKHSRFDALRPHS